MATEVMVAISFPVLFYFFPLKEAKPLESESQI